MRPRFLLIVPFLFMTVVLFVWLVALSSAASTVYGTFMGDELTEKGYGVVVDASGRAYVTGFTSSVVFPTATQRLDSPHGVDVIAARLNPDGTAVDYVLWFNAISALDEDYGYGIALGQDNSAYIVGQTNSPDFCDVLGIVPGIDKSYNGSGDGYLLKIKPDGSGLEYCTFLGGRELDTARAVAVDAMGYVYVTGGTWSQDFTPGATSIQDRHYGLRDAFLLRINPDGTEVVHASYIGGSDQEEGLAIVADSNGKATITGWTNSSDFVATAGAISPNYNGAFDAFVTSVDTATPDLVFSTYLGGEDEDRGYSLTTDPAGDFYLVGLTRSGDFPITQGAFMPAPAGNRDGYVVKLNSAGTVVHFGTYLGGSAEDQVNDIVLDSAGNAYLTGNTRSSDFPTSTNALSPTLPGPQSAFVSVLNAPGSSLLYSSYLGGSLEDEGNSIALGPDGQVYLAGATRSADFPATAGAYDQTHNGDHDVFVAMQVITTSSRPTADFVAAPLFGAAPLAVQFANLSAGDFTTVTWDFGDGAVSHVLDPLHTYQLPGAYTVTLTIAGPGGSDSLTRSAYIEVDARLYLPLLSR